MKCQKIKGLGKMLYVINKYVCISINSVILCDLNVVGS